MERRSFLRNIGIGVAGTLAGSHAFGLNRNILKNSSMKEMTQSINKFMMLTINVSSMQEAKTFYSEKLGLKIASEFRMDDNNWWVSLAFPVGGVTLTLARSSALPDNVKPGTLALYFETSDVNASHKELVQKNLKVNEVQDDLFGPGSGVKFFNFSDPDGNLVHIVQQHPARAPF